VVTRNSQIASGRPTMAEVTIDMTFPADLGADDPATDDSAIHAEPTSLSPPQPVATIDDLHVTFRRNGRDILEGYIGLAMIYAMSIDTRIRRHCLHAGRLRSGG